MPWMHDARLDFRILMAVLQFGHDTNAVDADLPALGATGTPTLQFGHDTNAVDAFRLLPGAVRVGTLQFGHDTNAVDATAAAGA